MPPTEYILTTDPRLQARVRARFAREIEALRGFGFRPLCTYLEQLEAFSALLRLPMLALILSHREVVVFPTPLRIAAAFALMHQPEPPTLATPMGMGVKLYTGFTDETLLISSSFQSYAVPRSGGRIEKLSSPGDLSETWRRHAYRVREIVANGKVPLAHASFDAYVEISRREEDPSQYVSPVG